MDKLETGVSGSDEPASVSVAHARPARLPSQNELPFDDGEKMESNRHGMQLPLLKDPLLDHWKDRTDFFIGTNMFVYFDPDQDLRYNFRGPDAFVALGVKPGDRKSYLTWKEGKPPDVVIELTSRTTRKVDRVQKKKIYQDLLGAQEYFWNDPYRDDFKGFELIKGIYRPIEPDANGMLPSKALGLKLTQWSGEYNGVHSDYWLRWATVKGILLPTRLELVRIERRLKAVESQRADAERRLKEDANKRAERLEALLKQHGIDPGA